MKIDKRFGSLLKNIRKEKGILQIFIAKKAGISNTYLSEIEKGKKKPTLETIDKITIALGLTFNQLLVMYLKKYAKEDELT